MKFNCGPGPETRRARRELRAHLKQERLSNWHSFFAILPRRVGENDCRWLERIERKGTLAFQGWALDWSWQYRAVTP